MGFADRYLNRQDHRYLWEAPKEMSATPLVVVIPCYDEPDIASTVRSVFGCSQPASNVVIVIVVNDSAASPAAIINQNRKTIQDLIKLQTEAPLWMQLYPVYAEKLPAKHAGAGWARKIGMDWAISHFNATNLDQGIIISLDADALVQPNYLQAIETHFRKNTNGVATTIYFEHRFDDTSTTEAIVWYELYMRYYKHALEVSGFPHALYALGSCFAVKASAYVAQGGMNRKKAGEDFYFLHKLLPLGDVGYCNSTTVYPSSRLSERVPFGTGPSLQKYLEGDRDLTMSYPLKAFEIILDVLMKVDEFYSHKEELHTTDLSNNPAFQIFAKENKLTESIKELVTNCSQGEIFSKRFFHLFNAFLILKWLNFAQDNGYEKTALLPQTLLLMEKIAPDQKNIPDDPKLMLKFYRSLDKAERFG